MAAPKSPEPSVLETTKLVDSLTISNVDSGAQQIKTEQLTHPENQEDFPLANLRLAEQNRTAVQKNINLLKDEQYEDLDSVTECQFKDVVLSECSEY